MIRLALLTPNPVAAEAIDQMTQESGVFRVVLREAPSPNILRAVAACDPEVVLLDANDWPRSADLVAKIKTGRRASVVGFRAGPDQQGGLLEAGFQAVLPDPFSAADLEAAAYQAMHEHRPIEHPNVFAFLPAKAGSGCSTVALNTAAILANRLENSTLLLETDRRSGVLSILLNVEDRGGLPKALANSGELTIMEWRQYLCEIGKLDMLLANPAQPGKVPLWLNYYQMLLFAQKQYSYILADLPEVINSATAEVVKAAHTVFIVCEPELPSLRLAALRQAELEAAEVPADRIRLLVNRWEIGRMNQEQILKLAGTPAFANLPNDYVEVKNAALEGRLVAQESAFGKACHELARRLSGLPEAPQQGSWKLGLLRRLGRSS